MSSQYAWSPNLAVNGRQVSTAAQAQEAVGILVIILGYSLDGFSHT